MVRLVLPGSTLAYGQTDSISKSMALIYAIWLVAGPSYAAMAYFVSKVRGVTSDYGIELLTVEIPNCLKAFLSWMDGAPLELCRHLVQHDKRLLWNALRIGGWSHTMGGIMQKIAEVCAAWPVVIAQLRALTAFFKNDTWRNVLQKALRMQTDVSVLAHFSNTIAKWRYETIALTLKLLAPLRDLASKVRMEFFPERPGSRDDRRRGGGMP